MSNESQRVQPEGRSCQNACENISGPVQSGEGQGGTGKATPPKHFNATHGLTKSREYKTWLKMKERCYNPRAINFERYGARGITVCDEWRNCFEQFLADMGNKPSPKHSIERVDNMAGYSKENCKWVTMKEQNRNRRSNHYVEYKGQTKSAAQWAEDLKIPHQTLLIRLNAGWAVDLAMETPVSNSNRWVGVPEHLRSRFAKIARASKNHPHPTKNFVP
jgi:hypothetical protein